MPHPRALDITLTPTELALVVDALDSHVYWQLSDPTHRSSGFAVGDGSADSDAADEIREATALQARLAALLS
jgi:hypothetical protein